MTLLGQVVLTAGSLSRETWSMLMSRRPVQRIRPSLVWVEWRGVSGPFSDPGGQYSHAVSSVCGVVECPWAYLGSRATGSTRRARALPRASGSRVRSPSLRRVTRRGGLRVGSAPLPGCACGGFGTRRFCLGKDERNAERVRSRMLAISPHDAGGGV